MSVLVSIRCLVYNHEPYLRQCLDGFVMQRTNFAFEAIVHDDASTDESAAIIKEYAKKYPNIIKPIYELENLFSKKDGSLVRRMNEAIHSEAKYIAICEGDDYWIDPDKLQKQVDFLEKNSDYSMCFHNAIEHWVDDVKPDKLFSNIQDRDYCGTELIANWIVPTASVVFRKEVYDSKLWRKRMDSKNFIYGDAPLFCTCAGVGKVRGMSMIASVYQRNNRGIIISDNNDESKWRKHILYNLEFPKVFGPMYRAVSINNACKLGVHYFYRMLFEKKKISLFYLKLVFRQSFLLSMKYLIIYSWLNVKNVFKDKIRKYFSIFFI